MKTVGIDLRCLPQDGTPGAGVAHAAREISRALVSSPASGVQWVLYIPRGASWEGEADSSVRVVELASASGSALRAAVRQVPCDTLFVPSGAVAPGLAVPTVPLVHDVAIFGHPEWFNESVLRRTVTTTLFRRGIMRAKRILSVSQHTKDDLVRLFKIDPSIISVTHEGGDTVLATLHGETLHDAKQRAKLRLAERGVTQSFILALGTVEPRKNLPVLIEAWKRLASLSDRPVDLVIAGRDGWKLGPIVFAIKNAYASEGGSRIHRVHAISDDDRRELLLAADIVAVPSLHEGFGLVALEAMQAGTAVVVSNAGALPEVVQDAGLVVSPEDIDAWAGALNGLLADDQTRKHLAEQGKAHSQGMTWERAAHIALQSLTGTAE